MKHKTKPITDQFRELYRQAGTPLRKVARETGLDVATLSRFANGERFLSPTALDILAEYFGWEAKVKKNG